METLPPITPAFKKFIRNLLTFGGLVDKHLDSFTSKESLKLFRIAFTHPSYSWKYNYEKMEILGDLVLNICVGEYIFTKYPDIINVNWISRMKHTLVSKKYLGMIAENHGFAKFLVYSEEAKKELESAKDQSLYNDMMEDTVEAFLGALREVCIVNKQPFGVFMALSRRILFKFLNELNIDPYDHLLYFDSVSQLKEIHDTYGWGFGKSIVYCQDLETGEHKIIVKTYPLGNQTPIPENQVLYEAKGFDKKKTKENAAFKALQGLEKIYNIEGKVPDPRAQNIWKPRYVAGEKASKAPTWRPRHREKAPTWRPRHREKAPTCWRPRHREKAPTWRPRYRPREK